MIDGMVVVVVGLVLPHSFLPAGESCSEVMVLAVRFQNRVSLAKAVAGRRASNRKPLR